MFSIASSYRGYILFCLALFAFIFVGQAELPVFNKSLSPNTIGSESESARCFAIDMAERNSEIADSAFTDTNSGSITIASQAKVMSASRDASINGKEDTKAAIELKPEISLWKVDEAHLANHNEGESYYLACGEESYIKYQGAGTSEDLIFVILNDGDAPMNLILPLSLKESSSVVYAIEQQPAQSSLLPGEKTHFVVRYTAPDTYTDDKAKVIIASDDPQNPACELNFDVGAAINPTFSKAFSPASIGPGNVSTLTFVLDNTGSITGATDINFMDNLPAGMTIANVPAISNTCFDGSLVALPGGNSITFTGGRIVRSSACQISVNVTSSTPGTHTNASGDLTSDAGNSGTASADLNVVTTLPGFSKSFSPSSVPLGGKSTLTFTIDNSANGSAVPNLDFTDNLPLGMVIADPPNASTDCESPTPLLPVSLTALAGSNTIVLDANGTTSGSNEVLMAGATCTVTVDVTATGVGTLTNITGDLLADFVSSGKASAILESTVTQLAIEKEFVDDPTVPGGTARLDFKISNFDRSYSATGIAFTDDLVTLVPALSGLIFSDSLSNSCGGTLTGLGGTTIGLTGGTIPPEGNCTVSVGLFVPVATTPGAYTNTTSAVSGMVDGSPVIGNMASDELFVEPIPILTMEFLEVGTLAPDPVVNPGDSVVVRYTISNTSITSGATDIAFLDELTNGGIGTGFLPYPVNNVSLPPIPNPPCGVGSSFALVALNVIQDRWALGLTGGTLTAAPGASSSCTFEVTIVVPAEMPPGIYTNTTEEITATVDGATRTGKPASDDLTVVSAPQLSKSFTDDPVVPGGTVTLEFTLTYPADALGDATDIAFSDTLSTVLTGLIATAIDTNTCTAASVDITTDPTVIDVSGGTLMPGEDCTITVTLDVPVGAAPGSYTNTTSNVTATAGGIATTSKAASDDLNVSGIKFSKEFLNDTLFAGETGTLRFTIDNLHPIDSATITYFLDNLAGALPGLAATATGMTAQNTCGGTISGTTNLIYTGGSVLSGRSCIIDVEFLVPVAAADGTYNNVTSSLVTSQGAAAPAVDQLVVNSNLISLTKEFTSDLIAPGDTAILKFTLTNLDPLRAISGLDFSDDLDVMVSSATFEGVVSNTCGGMASGLGTFNYIGGSIAAGDSCEIHIKVAIPSATAQGIYTNTTSEVTGMIAGLAVNGPSANDNLEVVQLLDFTKLFDGPSTATGTPKLTFTITNPGIDAVSDLRFSDDLDAVLSGLEATGLPVSDVCGMGSSLTSIGTSFLELTGASLDGNGGTCTFVVDLQVPAIASAGTYTNTSSPLTRNGLELAEPAIADLIIEPAPTFSKAFAPDVSVPGDISTLTFMIGNSASSRAATSLDFTDNLPSNVIIATPANASVTCTGGMLTAASGAGVISYTGGSISASTTSCTVQVDVTTDSTGAHVNTSGDLTSSSGSSGTATDTWDVACPMTAYSSTISGTMAMCINSAPDPEVSIKFVGGGVTPYTFIFSLNGAKDTMITSGMSDSIVISHPTSTAGEFTYMLVSAEDAAGCPGAATVNTAVITIDAQPIANAGMDQTLCNMDTFTMSAMLTEGTGKWSFVGISGSADIEDPNSPTSIITAIPEDMDITLKWTETNGTCSDMDDVTIEIASPEICSLVECTREIIFLDDELLAIDNFTDIVRAIERIESNATIEDTWFKTFKAGNSIEFFEGFTVEEGAIFIAEIESCMTQFRESSKK